MLHYFFKLKFYLGSSEALRVLIDKYFLKRKIRISFLKHPIVIRYDNFADNQTFNELILKGAYRELMADPKNVKRIIDLGSNIGLSAVTFLSEYPNVDLVLAEPEEANLRILRENIQPYLNEGRKIKVYDSPVYSKEVELAIFDSETGSHGFRVSEDSDVKNKLGEKKAVTINGILKEMDWDSVDMIKMDIEGAEYELMQANLEWIQKVKYLVIETHDRFKENSTKVLFKAMEPFNYRVRIRNENFFFDLSQN